MNSMLPAWAVPVWILGAPFLAIVVEAMRARHDARR